MSRKPISAILAANIKRAMDAQHLSGNRLAQQAGVAQTHLAKVLRGEASLSTDKLADVARGLGCDAWELLVDSDAVRERAIRQILAGRDEKKTA